MICLSLGAGRQSTTMLFMGLEGAFGPKPDAAIFADTGRESKLTYAHLDWLEKEVAPFPIHRVTAGNIRDDLLDRDRRFASIPVFVKHDNGLRSRGKLKRQCTSEYKLTPIARKVRELNGGSRRPVEQWIGISLDEAHRMKPSRVKYITHRWPLIEARMTAHDCLRWLKGHGYPEPPRSACIECPLHGDDYWRDSRENRPDEFAEACDFDRALRDGRVRMGKDGLNGVSYLHDSLIPLEEVDLSTPRERGQQEMFGNDCTGFCGV